MQEAICVNIGQAGIQVSNAAWELFCIEHGIEANGKLKTNLEDTDNQSFKTFFFEAPNGQFVPRTLTVDLEPTVIDEIKAGSYRKLFHPDQLINANDDGCNNYARAYFTVGKHIIEYVMDILRKITENCECLQGFFLLHSHGGGTGSGFASLFLQSLKIEYSKSPAFQLSVFPSHILSSAVVEPYNCVLCSTSDLEQSDITTIVSNEAMYSICYNMLHVSRPSFSNINRVLTHVFSDITASMRFESSLSSDFSQMCTNLIPYPKIHFPLLSHAPLLSENKVEHSTSTTDQITKDVFNSCNQLITCNTSQGLFMTCIMQYRGNVCPNNVNDAIAQIKRQENIKFVDWCPTGFKVGISNQNNAYVKHSEMGQSQRSLTMISNTTAIQDPIQKMSEKFDILLWKRSFIHWFVGEGMEEGEFLMAKDDINGLILDFMELSVLDDDENEKEDEAEAEDVHDNVEKETEKGSDENIEDVVEDKSKKVAKSPEAESETESEEEDKSDIIDKISIKVSHSRSKEDSDSDS